MKKLFNGFREFITRGNVIDLAVGIIIGSAFSSVINSVVNNLMMPPLGLLLGNADFSNFFLVLKQGIEPLPAGATLAMAQEAGAITLNYGLFITDVISFLMLALGVFLMIKGIQNLQNKMQKPESSEPEKSTERDCPYCLQSIPIKAIRCPYCTSQLTPGEGGSLG